MAEVVGSTHETVSGAIPSPLLTVLIADVRSYTRFTVEHGDAAAARLADRFAALCEEVAEQYEGQVIEFRGDESLCVFPLARSAIRAAITLQTAFRATAQDDPSLPLTVGIGIDAGVAIPLRGGYRGGTVNLAARLCSIAGGGEILASQTVIDLAHRTEGIAFVARGKVMLKGITTPISVFQVAPRGELPETLPPLQSALTTHLTNLPDDPTPFIGRDREIETVTALLQTPHVRLATLTGPGGIGKTRLAVQVGTALLSVFRDGVFFCELSILTEATLVPAAIARALGVKEDPGKNLIESLIAGLEEKHLLMVLDNFEHLLNAREVVAQLLDACGDLRILVTSRIPLHLSREHEHAVPPLSVPDPTLVKDLAALSQCESVALFIQRATAVKDSFILGDSNASAVMEICSRLDGLPLAIELAAARIKLFPPLALLHLLSNRLTLLTGGARDRPARHQTLRGALDWSYSLLTLNEHGLFARLSVFAGGCTFEAAEAACNWKGDLDLLDGLELLVDVSLVKQEGEEEARFSMLETIREYAAEKLIERGEESTVYDAHARYYVSLAEEAEPELTGPNQTNWYRRLDAELPNIRSALRYLLNEDRVEEELRLVASLYDYWEARSFPDEAQLWLEAGLRERDEQVSAEVRGRALFAAAGFANWVLENESATSRLEEALGLFQEAGNNLRSVRTRMVLGNLAVVRGDYEGAVDWYQRGGELSQKIGYDRGQAIATSNLGALAERRGDDVGAARQSAEALSLFRTVGDAQSIAKTLYSLARLLLVQGDLEEAERSLQESLELFREMGQVGGIAGCTVSLGAVALEQGRYDIAEARLHEGLLMFREQDELPFILVALQHTARLSAALGDMERAGRLVSALEHLRDALSIPVAEPAYQAPYYRTVEQVREALGNEGWERVQMEGVAMSFEEAVTYALQERV